MFKKPSKKDLKAARKAYKKLNDIPHQPTATALFAEDIFSITRKQILNLDTMMFLGYKIDSWLSLWASLRANYNEDNPEILAKMINIRGLK